MQPRRTVTAPVQEHETPGAVVAPVSQIEPSQDRPSPARTLQTMLAADLYGIPASEPPIKQWSPRAALLLSGAVSAALWGVLALALARIA